MFFRIFKTNAVIHLFKGDRDFVCTQQIDDCGWWSSNHWIRYFSTDIFYLDEILVILKSSFSFLPVNKKRFWDVFRCLVENETYRTLITFSLKPFIFLLLTISVNDRNIFSCYDSYMELYKYYGIVINYIWLVIYIFSLLLTANINDRSMLGDRDSELAVCVRDEKKTVSSI